MTVPPQAADGSLVQLIRTHDWAVTPLGPATDWLAELDRAKTVFFSNISHEFRTPLTLIMGPLEELRAAWPAGADSAVLGNLEVIHRNGLRLGKLVSTLLDFSRIEAGRMQASYEPVDLALVTTELAGGFRSAIEKAA